MKQQQSATSKLGFFYLLIFAFLFIFLVYLSQWQHFKLHLFNLITIALNILLLMLPLQKQTVQEWWSNTPNEFPILSVSYIHGVGTEIGHTFENNSLAHLNFLSMVSPEKTNVHTYSTTNYFLVIYLSSNTLKPCISSKKSTKVTNCNWTSHLNISVKG